MQGISATFRKTFSEKSQIPQDVQQKYCESKLQLHGKYGQHYQET